LQNKEQFFATMVHVAPAITSLAMVGFTDNSMQPPNCPSSQHKGPQAARERDIVGDSKEELDGSS
jgi:hypothetical protein